MIGNPLRARQHELRAGALSQLAEAGAIDTGLLRLVADAGAALAALDAASGAEVPAVVKSEPGDRCIVADDGAAITLTVYSADRRAACATVSATAAICIASR